MIPWSVPALWAGEPVVLVASGPSLTREDVDYCRGRARVLVINDNYALAPWADCLYACDAKWWRWHDGAPGFSGLRVTQDRKAAEEFGIKWLQSKTLPGLSDDPSCIHQGQNSGYQALNIAYLMGGNPILLLGYDMQVKDRGRPHWFGHHPDKVVGDFERYAQQFETIDQAKANIINCTIETGLTCFRRQPLRQTI